MSKSKMSKNISAYLFASFIKFVPLHLNYIKQYINIQNIQVYNEKRYLKLCDLLFPVWCWSRTCNMAWNILKQGSTHNPTLQFWHSNLILVSTQPHTALWTFKSYPCLLCVEHIQQCIHVPFWCQWSLFRTLSQLVEDIFPIVRSHHSTPL